MKNWNRFILCLVIAFSIHAVKANDLRGDSIDLCSYNLRLDLRDFENHVLKGEAEIKIKPKLSPAKSLTLDLLHLTVDSVKVNSRRTAFASNDSTLHINFLKEINAEDSSIIAIFYHGKPEIIHGDFGGFYWDDKYAFNIGVSFLSNPHNYGRAWFPCFDNFNVRSLYEFFITTRKKDRAFCNGILLDTKSDSIASVWHWKLNETIPSYLASVAVAQYEVLKDTLHGINGILPIEIAALAEDTAAVNRRFINLHKAFHTFEKYWGPYRWERIGYCIVPFQEGAMEHATNIAFMQNYLNTYSKDCEVTMAHELSHHWFGNLVTCDSAPEMWLNEAWATFSQSLFIEALYGADSTRNYRSESHLTELTMAHVNDKDYLPVNGVPSKYTYGTTVYQKGGDVIQTLRSYLGDSVFFHCVREYLDHFAFNTASTNQLNFFLSNCSGIDLTDFFNDWISSPGYTHFAIAEKQVKRIAKKYEVSVNIQQRLKHAPHFYSNVPVTISYYDDFMNRTDEVVSISGPSCIYTTRLNFKPQMIALDVDGNLAEAITAEQHILSDSGFYNFNNAGFAAQLSEKNRPFLLRAEEHWLAAPLLHSSKELFFNPDSYWTIDGAFKPSMKATGIFEYGGIYSEHSDPDFINSEDSLVLMYRNRPQSDWERANSFYVAKGDDDSDKAGAVIVSPLKKGDYTLAVYNAQTSNVAKGDGDLMVIKKNKKNGLDFKYSINKSKTLVEINLPEKLFTAAELFDGKGRKLMSQKINETDTKLAFKIQYTTNATYVVTLASKNGVRISKKIN